MKRFAIMLVAGSVLLLGWVVAQRHLASREIVPLEGSVRGAVTEGLTPEQERELHRIADLGYISGRSRAREATGVVRHAASGVSAGYTLFTYAKGPEAVLIDMDGDIRHSWGVSGSDCWARAHVYRNGDLLVITNDPYHLMRIDSNSNVLWSYDEPAHHDFDVLDDGTIWVLVRSAETRPDIHDGAWLLDDVLVHLDTQGRELTRVSILEAFERTDDYRDWVDAGELPEGSDIFHTNSIEIDQGAGRALVSIRSLGAVAMLDLEETRVEWAVRGPWRMQHEAQLVDGGLLLFDNSGLGEQSRVLEFDLESSVITWSYTEPGFLSRGVGAQQLLPNGNILISESEAGRIIEVTRSGDVVWEFTNPRTVGDSPERTLGIMRAVRVPIGFPMEWTTGDRQESGR